MTNAIGFGSFLTMALKTGASLSLRTRARNKSSVTPHFLAEGGIGHQLPLTGRAATHSHDWVLAGLG
jgi:hypothetical protein